MTRLVIATKGTRTDGLGHVVRESVLAHELIRRGVEVVFSTDRKSLGGEWLYRAGFNVITSGMRLPDADAGLMDFEHGPDRYQLAAARQLWSRLIVVAGNGYTLQDYPAVVEYADLEIYQGLDHMPGDKAVSGIEYIIIDPAYARCKPRADGPVIVVMGGTDPHELTPRALEALAGLDVEIKTPRGEPSLVPFMDGAALLVGAFGTVAWEALAAGLPCILTGWSEDHMAQVEKLVYRFGVAESISIWSEFRPQRLRGAVKHYLNDNQVWYQTSDRAKALVDGRGVMRVADKVCQLIAGQ